MILSSGLMDHPKEFTFQRKPGMPYWTASVIISGWALLATRDGEVRSQPGEATLIEPETTYRVRYGPGAPAWVGPWVIFDPEPGQRKHLDWPEILPGVRRLNLCDRPLEFERIATSWLEAQWVRRHEVPPLNEELANLAFSRGLAYAQACCPRAGQKPMDPRIRHVVAQLHRHSSHSFTVAELAKDAHLSPSHLAHLFREQVGQSPMRYQEDLRLKQAREELFASNRPIHVIAAEVGFTNPYHFSTRFRRRFGQSPRSFRKDIGQSKIPSTSSKKR